MISPEDFVTWLAEHNVRDYAGVPDSLLKNLGNQLLADENVRSHTIVANEGNAIGQAIGVYLGTGNPAAVYMQNSGLGNAINPILSLADKQVFGIPMIVIIGWRGRPGTKDEPQHLKQGRVMMEMINAMEFPVEILPTDSEDAKKVVSTLLETSRNERTPVFLVVRENTFSAVIASSVREFELSLPTREEALSLFLSTAGTDAAVFATTGMLSRELFELRQTHPETEHLDFMTVGGMGHASSIALGFALSKPGKSVWCLDGDGALLMHAGALATIGHVGPKNFRHLVFNNGVHDSVGGQPTSITSVDIQELGKAMGYASTSRADSLEELALKLEELFHSDGPALLEIKIRPGHRPDLGRPTRTPNESMLLFMANLAGDVRA